MEIDQNLFAEATALVEKEFNQVREAAIVQKGKRLSLAVVVGAATNLDHAKEIGERFVDQVRATLIEKDLEKEPKGFFKSRFAYLITITTTAQNVLASGAKSKFALKLHWS